MRNLRHCILLFSLLALWSGMCHGGSSSSSDESLEGDKTLRRCNRNEKFRRLDGQCTNVFYPQWGTANRNLLRLVKSDYEGGYEPRYKGKDGKPLPSARKVSLNCHPRSSAQSDVSLMVMQWGQFLDHDISLTKGTMEDSETVKCKCSQKTEPCFNIPLYRDPHFRGRSCLEFTRSAGRIASDDFGRARQQINTITPTIDASNVYGSSTEELRTLLRSRRSDYLAYKYVRNQGRLLPEDKKRIDRECKPKRREFCFIAGDERVNEQPALAVMHTVFMREHNRIVRVLRKRKVKNAFQVTRKIIGAMMQKITYSDFLPLLFSTSNYKRYGLNPEKYRYTWHREPGVFNAFATAAYRFGHSLIPEGLQIARRGFVPFQDMFFSPTQVLTRYDELGQALTKDKSMAVDRFFSSSITNHLFQEKSQTDGMDLVALNIQRGRDHGLPPYTAYRKHCGLPKITLYELFNGNRQAISTYKSVDDVDLFTGGMSEKPEGNGLLGATFQCLLGVQFQRLKEGDRFFYLNTGGAAAFTQAQRNEINKVSLRDVLCHNIDIRSIQTNVFFPASRGNPLKSCRSRYSINLRVFEDRSVRKGSDSSDSDNSS